MMGIYPPPSEPIAYTPILGGWDTSYSAWLATSRYLSGAVSELSLMLPDNEAGNAAQRLSASAPTDIWPVARGSFITLADNPDACRVA